MSLPTASEESRRRRARTGSPAKASTALMPTVLSNVLLPDMFEPLTIRTRATGPSPMSFRTQSRAGISGWPAPRLITGCIHHLGKGICGFSAAYAPRALSASNLPIASIQWATSGPAVPRQASIRMAIWVVQSHNAAIGMKN